MITSRRISPATRERRRVVAPLALAAGLAWVLLALDGSGFGTPAICSATLLWSVPSPEAFAFFFATASPWSLAAGWVVMVVAMMLPTACDHIVHVRERTLHRLKTGCLMLFLGGYVGTWIIAGLFLLSTAVTVRLASTSPLAPLALASGVAILWQICPWKQSALNQCHRRPSLAAFAPAAYRSALFFGARHGFWCIASCWALMVVALLAPAYHVTIMAVLAACIWAERLEPARPTRWQVRFPVRALRMMARLAPRPWARTGSCR